MNMRSTIFILFIILAGTSIVAQVNVSIPFNRIVFYDSFGLIESSNGTLYELENYKQSDTKLDLDEYNLRRELDPPIDGFNSFQKQHIGTEPLDDVIKLLRDENKCLLCVEEDEFHEEDSEWYMLDEDEKFKHFTINGTYHFLVGYFGLIFKYKGKIIILYEDYFCRISEINCDFEEKGTITFGTLELGKDDMGKVDFIIPRMDSYSIFYSKDSIYYLNAQPEYEINFNHKSTFFRSSVNRGVSQKKSIATEGSLLVPKEQFLDELKNKSFCYDYGSTRNCIQNFNENIFVHYQLVFTDTTKTQVKEVQVKDVFPLLIDDSSTKFTFGMGKDFLFLKKENGWTLSDFYPNREFLIFENKLIEDEVVKEIKLGPKTYRTVETKTGYGLKDYFSEEFYVSALYDSISVLGNFIVTKKDEQIYFFDKYFKKMGLDRAEVRDYYFTVNNVQVLIGNELFWLDQKDKLHREFTKYKPEVIYGCDCCGPNYDYSIEQDSTDFFMLVGTAEDRSTFPTKEIKKETIIIEKDKFDRLDFLNRKTDKPVVFQRYDRFFPKGITFIFSKNDKKGLFARVTDDLNVHQKDSILITGVDEFFPGAGILEPIKFRIKDKYGFYPLSQTAKYSTLGDFEYGFARFKLEDGTVGWINLNGKEFFDQ